MADRVKFAVSAIPIETLTDENSGTHDVIAGEIGKGLGGSGDSLGVANFTTLTAANQGYLNTTVNYKTASYAAGGTALTATATADFLFIKNTGHTFSSATVLGDVSTNVVIVAIQAAGYVDDAQDGWYTGAESSQLQFFEIAWLQPGQAIVLPLGCSNKSITQFGANTNDLANLGSSSAYGTAYIYVKTVVAAGTVATTSNAVEFLCVT